jgi:DNA-binding transcriptional ArsR family regulator
LRFIDQQPETVVSNIYKSLHLRQSVASLHLAVLKKSGFVNARREGKNIWYRVNDDKIHKVQRLIHKFLARLPFD